MKPIIIQEVNRVVVDGVTLRRVNAVFRFAVTDATKRVPKPDLTRSLHVDAPHDEVLLLKSGEEVERLGRVDVPLASTPAETRTALESAWTAANTEFQAELPGKFYGAYFDGTSWKPRGG